jgi:hypothetical protein
VEGPPPIGCHFRFAAAQRTTVKGSAVLESETPEWKMVRFDEVPA